MSERETYLGDGLYASFDGWQFALRAPRDGGNDFVYLEPSTLEAFERFVRDVRSDQAEAAYERAQDGECFRGGEYASALAEEQARIQRELK